MNQSARTYLLAACALVAGAIGVGSPSAVTELLLPAAPAGLVEGLSPSSTQVRFAHALVRGAAYASLSP